MISANVLLERETVEGEACPLDNTWTSNEDRSSRPRRPRRPPRARDEHLDRMEGRAGRPGDQDRIRRTRACGGRRRRCARSASSTSDGAPSTLRSASPEQKGDGAER
ncbi:MAG: hypothetical protein ACLT98_04980 [Eggerthellaceae bacterium]